MSIQDEINQRKIEMRKRSELKQIERQNGLKEAEKVIPEIAEFVKDELVMRAAGGNVEKRGLFKRKKYVKVEVKLHCDFGPDAFGPFSFYDEQTIKRICCWYRTMRQYPELHGKLANKLYSLGMSNVYIHLQENSAWYLYIYAELAMN